MRESSKRKLLIVTDLDSSLLDEDYGYSGAVHALDKLADLGYPLVLNSSKTYAELRELAAELPQCDAVVAENGGLIAVAKDSPIAAQGEADAFGYIPMTNGLARETILTVAHGLRENGYVFEGFSDWSVEQVIGHTGLSLAAAELAMERETTEPIHWHGSEQEWEEFLTKLNADGIKALRGGRFIHLMGQVDKVQGMQLLSESYQKSDTESEWTVVAIGDSANDKAMLEAADIAIVIPHADGPRVHPQNDHLIHASHPGSKGWGEAVLSIIKNQ